MKELDVDFFNRDTVSVARDLLGKLIVKGNIVCKIVETEAYKDEPGSHAYKNKITKRNKIMFGPPGYLYIYFTYGNHYLMNIVCEKEGLPGAVLIRALEPIKGVDEIIRNRGREDNLTNGPGKLTKALGIDLNYNGKRIGKEIKIYDNGEKPEIITSTRIGITKGADLPLRFYIKGNKWVSKY